MLRETIKSFLNLEDNWNGYGAKPISNKVINNALRVAMIFPKDKDIEIFPLADNGIQFEAEIGRRYFELQIYEERFHYYFHSKTEKVEKDINFDYESILLLIASFFIIQFNIV